MVQCRLARSFSVASLVALILAVGSPAVAISITYEALDLTDTTSGEDLWQYTYSVDDATFNQGFGFSIFFDLTRYTKLQDPGLPCDSSTSP